MRPRRRPRHPRFPAGKMIYLPLFHSALDVCFALVPIPPSLYSRGTLDYSLFVGSGEISMKRIGRPEDDFREKLTEGDTSGSSLFRPMLRRDSVSQQSSMTMVTSCGCLTRWRSAPSGHLRRCGCRGTLVDSKDGLIQRSELKERYSERTLARGRRKTQPLLPATAGSHA